MKTFEIFAPEFIASVEASCYEEAREKAERFCNLLGRKTWAVSQKEG